MAQITRKVIDLKEEKDIVTGLIVSTKFCEDVVPFLSDRSIFKDKNLRTIAEWAIDYYKRFTTSARYNIMDIFISNKKFIRDENDADTIQHTLEHLSGRYMDDETTYSESYYAHQSKEYIETRSIEMLADDLKGLLSQGKIDDAKKRLTTFSKVDKVLGTGADPFRDLDLIAKMFTSIQEGLFKVPHQALQEMLKDVFRGDVMAVAGPAKRGKSYLMNQLGYWALFSNLNVAIFNFEMDVEINSMRLWQNLLGESRTTMDKPGRIPMFKGNEVTFHEIKKDGLLPDGLMNYRQKFLRYQKMGKLRLFDAHSSGRRVSDIVDALNRIERFDDIKIDVVIIDYDALLENEYGYNGNPIDANTQLWKDMKAKIAQDLDCLVITGSQMTREAIKGEAGVDKTAGNIRKFDYVSHWISINQTEDEKRLGLMRLDTVGRHDEFNGGDKVLCTQALAIGRPITDARWLRDVENYKDLLGKRDDDEHEEQKPRAKNKAYSI